MKQYKIKFSGSELGQDSRRKEQARCLTHRERRATKNIALIHPPKREVKKWLISALRLRRRSALATPSRRAWKSPYFLTSKF